MASFEESLKSATTTTTTPTVPLDNNSFIMEATVGETFQKSDKYTWYNTYSDEDFSIIDSAKNVKLSQNQINITQEENSQVIPFQLNRFYDGVDLMNMNFRIHFVNAANNEGFATPINVTYSDTKIRFYWLVDNYTTAVKGKVKFEIQATGTNELGLNYVWKTKPNNDELNVLESLSGNGVIEPSDEWYTQFIRDMDTKVAQAQSYANEAKDLVADANAAIEEVNTKITNVQEEIKSSVIEDITTSVLLNYYTKEEVDQIVKNLDFSDVLAQVEKKIDAIDGLASLVVEYNSTTNVMTFKNGETEMYAYTLNTNPTAEWTSTFRNTVKSDIDNAVKVISDDLDTYKTENDANVAQMQNVLDGVETDLSENYYNKKSVDTLLNDKASASELSTVKTNLSVVESTANSNKTNLSAVSTKISELEKKVNDVNTDPSLSYYATYDTENKFTLWEVQGDTESVKSQFTISGGGGGGATTTTTVRIDRITTSPLTLTKDDKAVIKYRFSSIDSSGDDTGEGTAVWKVGNTTVATSIAIQGENSFDITEYVSVGTQKVTLTVTDAAGTISVKTWTVQLVDVRIESSFNDSFTYPIGTVSFDYIPYGAIEKTVHFVLDGEEIGTETTSNSGIPMSYTIPSQPHGTHLFEVYITAELNNTTIETNHIYKDIIWYDETSEYPVIGCVYQNITVKQYDSTNIVYTIYDPTTETPKVTLAVDGDIVSTLTLEEPTNIWHFKSNDIGDHVLTITCRDVVKTINVTVEKLDINVEPVTANLAFDFNPSGKSNNDEDRLWSDGTTSMVVSDNFDWVNGGYQLDDNGDQYFCIKAGTTATIDYNLFADDARKNGKEFKVVFKTTNVRKSDATFLTCQSTSSPVIGLQMNVHEAYIKSSVKSLYVPYSEEDIIEFEFNINKDSDIPIVMAYEDGTPGRPMSYTSDHSFTQSSPVPITIGSADCDVWVYRMKAYSASLTNSGILSNFIADARNATEMINRYTRNQIYDENNQLTPESVAKACPDLKIIKIECPHFTNDKKDFVKGTSVECIHIGGDPILDNWKAVNCYHSGRT